MNLILNKVSAHWDLKLLAGFDEAMLGSIGWSQGELDEVFGLDIADDFDVEAEKQKLLRGDKMRTESGQMWILGDHKLVVGDCTDRKNWERVMGGERFDYLLTDPPYRLAYSKTRVRRIKTKGGIKLKRARTYDKTGETNRAGNPKGVFGTKGNRSYEGVEMSGGVPEYDAWLSIADAFAKESGSAVMIFESWKNTVELWQAIEKYWKIKNLIIWHTPNRNQGFGSKDHFFNKLDIAPLADRGSVPLNEEYEQEMEEYLREKGQKLLDSYDVVLYAGKGKHEFGQGRKGQRWMRTTDHITANVESASGTGQSIVFGAKPVQILVPYIKILCPRGGIVAEPFAGSGSTIISSEIMKRRCCAIEISPLYAEVILRRWEKFTGLVATKA